MSYMYRIGSLVRLCPQCKISALIVRMVRKNGQCTMVCDNVRCSHTMKVEVG